MLLNYHVDGEGMFGASSQVSLPLPFGHLWQWPAISMLMSIFLPGTVSSRISATWRWFIDRCRRKTLRFLPSPLFPSASVVSSLVRGAARARATVWKCQLTCDNRWQRDSHMTDRGNNENIFTLITAYFRQQLCPSSACQLNQLLEKNVVKE